MSRGWVLTPLGYLHPLPDTHLPGIPTSPGHIHPQTYSPLWDTYPLDILTPWSSPLNIPPLGTDMYWWPPKRAYGTYPTECWNAFFSSNELVFFMQVPIQRNYDPWFESTFSWPTSADLKKKNKKRCSTSNFSLSITEIWKVVEPGFHCANQNFPKILLKLRKIGLFGDVRLGWPLNAPTPSLSVPTTQTCIQKMRKYHL